VVTASTSNTAVRGIICNSTANATAINTITNNTISNITTAYSATGAQGNTLTGIAVSTGASTVSGNLVRNLASNSQTTAGTISPVLIGIAYNSNTGPAVITGNTIHSLRLTHPGTLAATICQGIYFTGPSAGNNIIEKNFIHSFSVASPSNSAGFLNGLEIGGGTVTVRNNMIRLGVDPSGNNITSPLTVRGIANTGLSGGPVNVYFNSVYIGGVNVGSSAINTFCFHKNSPVVTDIRNNIFQNSRSNAGSGGKHYSVYLQNTATTTINSNDYFGDGTGYVFGFSGADVPSYSVAWFAGDISSQAGDPQFMNPIGPASSVNLHIDPSVPTIVEQTGMNIASITDDFDGQSRGGLTPEDMGADAGNFIPNICSSSPSGITISINNTANICETGSRTLSLVGMPSMVGFTY
jgi:hypothetical protein